MNDRKLIEQRGRAYNFCFQVNNSEDIDLAAIHPLWQAYLQECQISTFSCIGYCLTKEYFYTTAYFYSQNITAAAIEFIEQFTDFCQQKNGLTARLAIANTPVLIGTDDMLMQSILWLHHLPVANKLTAQYDLYPYSSHHLFIDVNQSTIDNTDAISIISHGRHSWLRIYQTFMNSRCALSLVEFSKGNHPQFALLTQGHYVPEEDELHEQKAIPYKHIIELACNRFDIKQSQLFSKKRNRMNNTIKGVITECATTVYHCSLNELSILLDSNQQQLSSYSAQAKRYHQSEISEIKSLLE